MVPNTPCAFSTGYRKQVWWCCAALLPQPLEVLSSSRHDNMQTRLFPCSLANLSLFIPHAVPELGLRHLNTHSSRQSLQHLCCALCCACMPCGQGPKPRTTRLMKDVSVRLRDSMNSMLICSFDIAFFSGTGGTMMPASSFPGACQTRPCTAACCIEAKLSPSRTAVLLLQAVVEPCKVAVAAYDLKLAPLVLWQACLGLHLVRHIRLPAAPLSAQHASVKPPARCDCATCTSRQRDSAKRAPPHCRPSCEGHRPRSESLKLPH